MLIGPLPGLPVPDVLRDPAPDPGLFGPGSVTWRLAREPLLLLGGGRALMMQVAHPLVAQGVVDHSAYETQPFGRLLETVRWLVVVIFGTTAEAEAAITHLAAIHRRVRGVLVPENATAAFLAGTPYDANDPTLDRWVLATILDSVLVAADVLIDGLPQAARDRFVREWRPVGRRLGIPEARLWDGEAVLRAYVASELASGRITPTPAARRAAAAVLHPELPWPGLQPIAWFLGAFSAGLLPSRLRRGLGVRWTPLQARGLRLLCALSRAGHPFLPRRMRVAPLYDIARGRVTRRRLPVRRRG